MTLSFSGASSCATPVLPTIRPATANKYEAPYRYTCDGKEVFAAGVSHCQYKEGDLMKIRIKAPASKGEIQIRSCRHHAELDINEDSAWQDVEWIQYKYEDSCPIVMSVATKDADVQIGKINPYVYNDKYPKLNGKGSLYCWDTQKNSEFVGQTSCQFPTGITVDGYLTLDAQKSGAYLVKSVCGLSMGPVHFNAGTPQVKWQLFSNTSQYCPVSAAVKYDDGQIEEYEVYIDFFDSIYRALPAPILVQDKKESYACAPQDFSRFDLNDHTKKSGLLRGHCIEDGWDDSSQATGIAWDAAGRVSIATLKCEGDKCPKPKNQ